MWRGSPSHTDGGTQAGTRGGALSTVPYPCAQGRHGNPSGEEKEDDMEVEEKERKKLVVNERERGGGGQERGRGERDM